MKSKKPSLYDAQEEQIQLQSASFVDFLTRKGVLEDHNIDNERVRKAKKDTAQRAYHNTEVLLSQYRLIIWVLECIPGELSDELEVPVHDIDALAEKIDIQTSLENARIESRVNAMMKTRYLVDRIHEALAVIRKKPGNGEDILLRGGDSDALQIMFKPEGIFKHIITRFFSLKSFSQFLFAMFMERRILNVLRIRHHNIIKHFFSGVSEWSMSKVMPECNCFCQIRIES